MFPKLYDGLMSIFPSISVSFKLKPDFEESCFLFITDEEAMTKSDKKHRLKGEMEK